MSIVTRKDIAERVITKWRDLGFPVDTDAEFQALLGLWINGDVSVDDVRRRYVKLLRERYSKRKPD